MSVVIEIENLRVRREMRNAKLQPLRKLLFVGNQQWEELRGAAEAFGFDLPGSPGANNTRVEYHGMPVYLVDSPDFLQVMALDDD